MSFKWEDYLVLAKELSQRGNEAATRSAISRAYYAAYQAARRHPGSKNAMVTKSGSHGAVWKALRESGNRNWRKAGNQGKEILEYRGEADYDDSVPELTRKMYSIVRMAEEILRLLGS
ncbi:MAG: DNA-binding protein [Bryobacteraceae bacterium]